MTIKWIALLFLALGCGDARPAGAQGTAALRAGRYDEAVPALARLADAPGAPAAARRQYVRALVEVGRHADAEAAARRYTAPNGSPPAGAELATALGEVLYLRGDVAGARAAFERALAERASDTLTARVHLAALRHEAGERDAAARLFRQVAAAIEHDALTAADLVAVGVANRHLGATDHQRFRVALRAFDAAAALDTADLTPRVLAGELFLEKYNGEEAQKSFADVLRANPRHPRALLGLARVRQFDGANGVALADSALRANPAYADAHLFRAAAAADAEDYAGAHAAVRAALAVDSTSPDALTMLAAVRYLEGDRRAVDDVRRRVLARAPRHAEFFATLADLSARHRLYREAASFAAEGVALDPAAWRAHALRGINQLRLGHPDSARASLETAFRGDPYDVWTKNTLDLLDATRGYRTERTPRFAFVADSAESALLALYLGELLERGYDEMAKRYAYAPPTPIRLELFRRHADFSVRTVGLTGLGALGVSFGPVLAMDAPSARPQGEFHWGSTAWHELAHTFTLGATGNRVPRWFSEGLSVVEQRRAHPGWGDGPTPEFLAAYQAGRVPPPSRLNDGFMRPAFPQQVMFSYYAASLVCDFVEREAGAQGIAGLLAAYREGLTTEAAIGRVLRVDLATLDRRFDAYVRERFGRELASAGAPGAGDFGRQLAAAAASAAEGKQDEAIATLERAKALFPDYAQDGSPYHQLAAIYQARGDARRAAHELGELTKRNAGDYGAHLALAALREQLGDSAGAAAALEQAIFVSPYDPAVHARLAALAAATGDRKVAVRERRAVVALAPVDVAEARYQLALALYQSGDMTSARRELLRALERAPSFAPAQDLLLKLQPSGGP